VNRIFLALNLYDLLFVTTIVIGLVFALLLCFTRRINRKANIFLGLSVLVIVFWMTWVLAIDIRLGEYFPYWSWLPLQYSLALGPAIYFYVRRLVQPNTIFKAIDLWHFTPVVVELVIQLLQIVESRRTHKPTYNTAIFRDINPLLQLLALVSVVSYLVSSTHLLKQFQRDLNNSFSDEKVYQYRWLRRLLIILGVLWLLWIPFDTIDFIFYDYNLGLNSYYPLYLALAAIAIWISAEAFLRPEVITVEMHLPAKNSDRQMPDQALLERADWLKRQVEMNLFYLDPALSLRTLAEQLNIHPNELSRIANSGLGKSFNDFINEFRIQAVIKKMQDPSFEAITLLGIAFDSGFNSKTTFNRTFKEITGKTPAAYKRTLQTGAIV